jgi:hypothetical protein
MNSGCAEALVESARATYLSGLAESCVSVGECGQLVQS